MIKLLFLVHRKADLSRQECLAQWTGEKHLALLEPMKKLGFKKYVQNRVTSQEPEWTCPQK